VTVWQQAKLSWASQVQSWGRVGPPILETKQREKAVAELEVQPTQSLTGCPVVLLPKDKSMYLTPSYNIVVLKKDNHLCGR